MNIYLIDNLSISARQAVSKSTSVHRPDLIWDAHLAAAAEQWAQHLVAQGAGLQHSTGDQRPGQGENLYWQSAGGTLANASQSWVNEDKDYHGEKIGEGNFEAYGHYTQVCAFLLLLSNAVFEKGIGSYWHYLWRARDG